MPEKFTLDELFERATLLEKIDQAMAEVAAGQVRGSPEAQGMVEITWSNPALESIHAASKFHRPYSAGSADALVKRIFEKVFLLESHPMMGRAVPEFNQADLRELL